MDRRGEYRPSEEEFWAKIDELARVIRYSEENRDRVEKLKNAGLSTRTAHLLARNMEKDGPSINKP